MARLTGEHITLREFRWEDLPELRRWITDPQATRYLGARFIHPQTWEQTESWLRSLLSGDVGGEHLVVADRGTLNYLGQIDLQSIDALNRSAEMALVICPQYWGKGAGREAVQLMLRHAFWHLNLNRVHLKVFADNTRAVRLYEQAGFVREGLLRQDAFLEGRYRDTLLMSMLLEEYLAAHPISES